MKFTVKRASMWESETPPCEEAARENIIDVDTRTFRSPEAFDAIHGSGAWFSKGTNHTINEMGCITREIGMVNVWMIEINTLDELMKFYEKYGNIIIQDCIWNKSYKEILIYDDYIE